MKEELAADHSISQNFMLQKFGLYAIQSWQFFHSTDGRQKITEFHNYVNTSAFYNEVIWEYISNKSFSI